MPEVGGTQLDPHRAYEPAGEVVAARLDLLRGPLAEVDGLEATRAVARRLNGVHDDPLPATLHVDAQLALLREIEPLVREFQPGDEYFDNVMYGSVDAEFLYAVVRRLG